MAQFELLIPATGESEPRLLTVAPLVAGAARIDVMVLIGDDVYRELVIELLNVDNRPLPDSPVRGGSAPEESTGSAPSPGGPMRSAVAQAPPPRGNPSNASIRAPSPSNCRRPRAPQARPWRATTVTARRILPAAHTQLRPLHRWQEPGATLTLVLGPHARWDLERGRGDTAQHTWGDTEWNPDSSDVLPNILTAREALDRVREFNSDRENTIDPADLSARLERFEPTQDWTAVTGTPTGQALAVGEQSALTHEMRALAFSGSELFDALFPPSSTLRAKVDALGPGDNLRIIRSPAGPSLPHVPWPLLYRGEIPAAGTAVDPQSFLGMRLRTADLVKTCEADRSLTPEAIRAHLLYWGGDETEDEARKHRSELDSWSPFFLPTGVAQRKEELSAFLSSPEPRPVSLIYLFCQCSTGSGAAPVLRFGSTNRTEDVLELMDMGRADLVDQPLVFINACATSAADPNFTNQLQSLFLRRGCRAYIGTECKVPTGFAARFATAFFHFLYLHDSSGRTMAAGEAFAQARKFFWDEYRSLGGLYYSYVNDDRIYVARSEEVAALR
ncbi:CHAT domain-containing protein [Streptomyces sp. SAS_272]|uniref:CHAT domain-containing protein n=2 Tax=Streptomyces TaxID=1883 RepID=UPI00403C385A